jgi:hypothetical protein
MGVEQKQKSPSVQDVNIQELKRQLGSTTGDETTQIVPTEDGFEKSEVTATQVKVPKGGRFSGGSSGYEAVGEEHLNVQKNAVNTVHVHKDEGPRTAAPTDHDFNAVRTSGNRPMYFSSRYMARNGKDADGNIGNYIILRSTGSHHLARPSLEYRTDPQLSMRPLR